MNQVGSHTFISYLNDTNNIIHSIRNIEDTTELLSYTTVYVFIKTELSLYVDETSQFFQNNSDLYFFSK